MPAEPNPDVRASREAPEGDRPATRGPQLRSVTVADSPLAWAAAGFRVDAEGTCRIGSVAIRLIGQENRDDRQRDDRQRDRADTGGFRSWGFEQVDPLLTEIDGLIIDRTGPSEGQTSNSADLPGPSGDLAKISAGSNSNSNSADSNTDSAGRNRTRVVGNHPNGVTSIDHIVVASGNPGRTVDALEAAGFPKRRERHATDQGAGVVQHFFWAGDVIIELIGPGEDRPLTAEPCKVFGLALVSEDLDATSTFLGDRISPVREAVQKGRRIATLRTRDLGISLPVAIMSPHPH